MGGRCLCVGELFVCMIVIAVRDGQRDEASEATGKRPRR